jgi:hypothetical protein
VATAKVMVVAPAGTVTEAGTLAPGPADKLTAAPPVGAARDKVTMPVEELPPTTELGETDTLESRGVISVS